MSNLPKTDRAVKFVFENLLFLLILVVALQVWIAIFNLAVADYMDTSFWRTRGVWLGNDVVDIFGLSVSIQFEGYTDYSFYYVHWGHNILRGVLPYDADFGYIILRGYTNENGAYMFPPFYAYLYAAGIALPVDNWGIGLLIASFGYLTVFPVYGIARELSKNRRVGEVAAFTYLFNPLTLYYTLFIWLNPAPFIFFFFCGFYMLIKGRKHTGTILIVCAALFKQTAWFLGIPLIVYLVVRQQPPESEEMKEQRRKMSIFAFARSYFDLRGFMGSVALVLSFVLAVFLPYIIATPWFLNNLSLAAGGFPLDSFTELPGYGSPIRFQVLPVAAGLPGIAMILDLFVYYGFLLTFGVMAIFGFMLLERKSSDRSIYYMRRLLFLAMILMLWVHLMGPRGVYKYYFVLFAPFFSIFSSARMITSEDDRVPFSYSMLILPWALALAIMIPSRSIYLFPVLLIFISYVLADKIGAFWLVITTPVRWMKRTLSKKLRPLSERIAYMRETRGPFQEKLVLLDDDILKIRFIGALDQLFRRQKTLQSQLYLNSQLVSEKSATTWSSDEDDLSYLSHSISIKNKNETITYEIEHLSSISMKVRVRRNGEIVRL